MKHLLTLLLALLILPIYSQSITRLTNFDPDGFEAISPLSANIITGVDDNIYFVTNFEFNRELYFSDGTIEGTGEVPNILYEYDSVSEIEYSEDYIYFCVNTDQTSHYSIYQFSRNENIELAWDGFPEGAYSITNVNNSLFFVDVDGKLYKFIEYASEVLFEEGKVKHLIDFQNSLYFIYETGMIGPETGYTLAKYLPQTSSFQIINTSTRGNSLKSFLTIVDDCLVYGIENGSSSYQAWKLSSLTGDFKEIPYNLPVSISSSIGKKGYTIDRNPSDVNSKIYTYDIVSEVSTTINIGNPSWQSVYRKHNEIDGKLYFLSKPIGSSDNKRYIYESDLTVAGTHQINLQDSESGGDTNEGYSLRAHDGDLFHTPLSSIGRELWKTDPSNLNNYLVQDLFEGFASSNPIRLFSSGENLYFFAETEELGYQLYVYNNKPVSTDPSLPTTEVKIGPNPVKDNLQINFENRIVNKLSLSVTNYLGEIVLTKELNSISSKSFDLDLGALNAGIYFIEIDYDNKKEVHKIIKL